MTIDRQSATGSGPTASRIVLGSGAAMAVPFPGRTPGKAAPAASEGFAPPASAAGEAEAAVRGSKPFRFVATLFGSLAVISGIAYERMYAPSAGSDMSTQAVTAAPAPATPAPAPSAGILDEHRGYFCRGAPEARCGGRLLRATGSRDDGETRSPGAESGGPCADQRQPAGRPSLRRLRRTVPPAAASPAPSATKPAVDCNPSYYYDADGNKHFKPECFGR